MTELAEKLKEWLESEECIRFYEELNRKQLITEGRYSKFEKYVQTIDFDDLIYRLILEHGEEYNDKFWSNGEFPYPNNKLSFLFDYVMTKFPHVDVEEIDYGFMNEIREFKGYYFKITHGQGIVFSIYNKKDLQLILQI